MCTCGARSYLFVRLSPVLGAAVEMERGGSVEVHLTPAGLALPAEATAVRLEPMHLALASRGPVQNLIRRGPHVRDRLTSKWCGCVQCKRLLARPKTTLVTVAHPRCHAAVCFQHVSRSAYRPGSEARAPLARTGC